MTETKPSLAPEAGRKKICMVLYHTEPSSLPPLFNAALSFAQEGLTVETICVSTKPGYPKIERVQEGFQIRRFYFGSRTLFHVVFGLATTHRVVALAQYVVSYAEFITRSFSWAWRANADLYEAHDLPALLPTWLAATIRRRPLVYHAHELYAEMHNKMRFARFWKFMEKQLVPRTTLVVTPEHNRSRIYLEEYHPKRQPLTIANCPPFVLPLQSTKLRDDVRERGIRCDTIVLYQGLLDTSRCIEELISSAEHFREGVVLVLLGRGYKGWEEPEKRFPGAKNVIFLPPVRYKELFQYTASADIGVLFYRNDCRNNYYCAPNKLYEFMMMGLPVITCDYPGLREIVGVEQLGLCVDPENPVQIAEAINKLSSDQVLYDRMHRNGLRLTRDRFNWQKEFEKLQAAYRPLLGHVPEETMQLHWSQTA